MIKSADLKEIFFVLKALRLSVLPYMKYSGKVVGLGFVA